VVSQIQTRTQAEHIREQDAEEDIWTSDGKSNRSLEKSGWVTSW